MFNDERYPYAQGPLLEQPNTYFYTRYHGEAFLDAWLQTRSLASMPENISRPSADISQSSVENNAIVTRNLLLDLITHQAEQAYWWPRLVKKFEVKKRLFAAYQSEPPHRPVIESGYQDLDIYLLFAEWLVISYQHQAKLQLLNTLLKVMDTLISQQKQLFPRQQNNIAWLLQQEKVCVSQLQQTVIA
jgi:hypothetical protein